MEMGTSEAPESDPGHPAAVEELPVHTDPSRKPQQQEKSKDVHISKSKEDLNGRSEVEEQESSGRKYELHIIEDLDEFVETLSEISEAAPEETVTKATRNRSAESKAGSRHKPEIQPFVLGEDMCSKSAHSKKRAEPRTLGPVRESSPWEGITLNKCLVVASFVALLSMGFQVLQDVDTEDDLAEVVNGLPVQPESISPEVIADDLPEPWFFESWFETSSELQPEKPEEEEEEEEIASVPAASMDLKERPEKSKSPRKLEGEVKKRRSAKQKEDRPPAKPEKTKPEKTSQASSLPKDKSQQTKATKPWKPSKDEFSKREDAAFQNKGQERKARSLFPEKKVKVPLKGMGEKGRPHEQGKQDRSEKPGRGHGKAQQGEEHRRGFKNGQPEDKWRQGHRGQREAKWHKKDNQRVLNGSRAYSNHKFFPKKNEKERFSPKHKHGAYKEHD